MKIAMFLARRVSLRTRYRLLITAVGVTALGLVMYFGLLPEELFNLPSALIIALGINVLSPPAAKFMVSRLHHQ